MDESVKSYRIHTNIGEDRYVNVPISQDYEIMEILSLKLSQSNFYKFHTSNYGVLVGRVLANGAFGVQNVKISVFIPLSDADSQNNEIAKIYPYTTVNTQDSENRRYNLLPDSSNNLCSQVVGTFPNKRLVLDNDTELDIYDKYWKFTTVTNESGDYCIYGLPTGNTTVHYELDLSDCGILSQKPRDMEIKGYTVSQFENPLQFKKDTNLDNLTQIISQNSSVYIYPLWGDETVGEAAITRNDVKIQYRFEPTCVFMGSLVTDSKNSSIGFDCSGSKQNSENRNLSSPKGNIEMIRKTLDNFVEEYQINGNQLIDGDGVWCYQIPMNLDYVGTDEYGNIVPIESSEKGIPTRSRVRFRISVDETDSDGVNVHHGKLLIPNNPILNKNGNKISIVEKRETDEVLPTDEEYYEFGSATPDNCFRDLYWNKVYTIKSYIPRFQKGSSSHQDRYTGIRLTNYNSGKNPFPYNTIRIHLTSMFRLLCTIFHILGVLVTVINSVVSILDEGLRPLYWMAKALKWSLILKPVGNLIMKLVDLLTIKCVNLEVEMPGASCKNTKYYLGCWSGLAQKKTKKSDGNGINFSKNENDYNTLIEDALAQENELVSLDFYNDWVNGCAYLPLWEWRKRTKKTYFFGLFGHHSVNSFCNCDKLKRAYLFQQCVDVHRDNGTTVDKTGKGNWHDSSDHTSSHWIGGGVIKDFTNKDGQHIYYYAHGIVNKYGTNEYYRLYASDIVLLGSLLDCDEDGLTQFYKRLPTTTHNPIPFMKEDYINCDEEDDDGSSANIEARTGYDTRVISQITKSKANYGDGYFFDVGCNTLSTFHKTCINASRLCEIGVIGDMQYEVQTIEKNDFGTRIEYSDGMVTRKELIDNDSRAEFATMNTIGFDPFDERIDKRTGYKKYRFKYMYPSDFDGSLSKSAQDYTISRFPMTTSYDLLNKYYVEFRYGTSNNVTDKTYGIDNKFPIYNNSFYFYFGLKDGSTAIDKFNKNFGGNCIQNKKYSFNVSLDITDETVCGEIFNKPDGTAIVTMSGQLMPITYTLYDSLTNEPISVYIDGKEVKYEDIKTKENPFTLSNLSNGVNYTLSITDSNGHTVEEEFMLFRQLIELDYSHADLGAHVTSVENAEQENNCNNYYAGDVIIRGITINGEYYDSTKIDVISVKSIERGEEYSITVDGVHKANLYLTLKSTEFNGEPITFLQTLCNKNYNFEKYTGTNEDGYYHLKILIPAEYALTTKEVCENDGVEKETDINSTDGTISIANAEPFNMYINTMPYEFLYDKYYKEKNSDVLSLWPVINDVNNLGINSSYNTEKWISWDKDIPFTILNNKVTFTKESYIEISKFKLNTILKMCNGAFVTIDDNPHFNISADGGKAPLLINTLYQMTSFYDLYEYTPSNQFNKYTFSSQDASMSTQNDGSNIIYSNYKYLKDGFWTNVGDDDGLSANPLVVNKEYQGFYCAAFTNNGGYYNTTGTGITVDNTIPIPANSVANAYEKHIISKSDTGMTLDSKLSKVYEGTGRYFKNLFTDKRLDFDIVFLTASKELDGVASSGVVSGTVLNGIGLAYEYYSDDDSNNVFNYNIISRKTNTFTAPTADDITAAKNDTNAEYYYNISDGTIGNSKGNEDNGANKKLYSLTLNDEDVLHNGGVSILDTKETNGRFETTFRLNYPKDLTECTMGIESCSYDIDCDEYSVLDEEGTETNSFFIGKTQAGDTASIMMDDARNITLACPDATNAAIYPYDGNAFWTENAGWSDVITKTSDNNKSININGVNIGYNTYSISPMFKVNVYENLDYSSIKTRVPVIWKGPLNDLKRAAKISDGYVREPCLFGYLYDRIEGKSVDYLLYGGHNYHIRQGEDMRCTSLLNKWAKTEMGIWPARRYGSWDIDPYNLYDFPRRDDVQKGGGRYTFNTCSMQAFKDLGGDIFTGNNKNIYRSDLCKFDDPDFTYMVQTSDDNTTAEIVAADDDMFYNTYFGRKKSESNDGSIEEVLLNGYKEFSIITDTIATLEPFSLSRKVRIINCNNTYDVNDISIKFSMHETQGNNATIFEADINPESNKSFSGYGKILSSVLYVRPTTSSTVDGVYKGVGSSFDGKTTKVLFSVPYSLPSLGNNTIGLFLQDSFGLIWAFKYGINSDGTINYKECSEGMSEVTIPTSVTADTDVTNIKINGDNIISSTGTNTSYNITYTPSNTPQVGVLWRLEGNYDGISIDTFTGALTVSKTFKGRITIYANSPFKELVSNYGVQIDA
jgi:hypothetical protein